MYVCLCKWHGVSEWHVSLPGKSLPPFPPPIPPHPRPSLTRPHLLRPSHPWPSLSPSRRTFVCALVGTRTSTGVPLFYPSLQPTSMLVLASLGLCWLSRADVIPPPALDAATRLQRGPVLRERSRCFRFWNRNAGHQFEYRGDVKIFRS